MTVVELRELLTLAKQIGAVVDLGFRGRVQIDWIDEPATHELGFVRVSCGLLFEPARASGGVETWERLSRGDGEGLHHPRLIRQGGDGPIITVREARALAARAQQRWIVPA